MRPDSGTPSGANPAKEDTIAHAEILRYEQGWERISSPVVKESSLTIFLNGDPVVNLLCTANGREFLAIGFLAMERFIEPDEVRNVKITSLIQDSIHIQAPLSIRAPDRNCSTITPGLGKGITFSSAEMRLREIRIASSIRVKAQQVFHLMRQLGEHSSLYALTHGVHNAAVCSPERVEIFQYDLGRHNAIDKLYGQCLMGRISLGGKIIVTSGRVSSEILTKVGVMGVPILISRSAPTDRAIRLAEGCGITLIARVQEDRMSVYAYPERVSAE